MNQTKIINNELGYALTRRKDEFLMLKKRDDANMVDSIIVYDTETGNVTGYLLTLIPIHTIDEIAHQYKIFRELQQDIKAFEDLIW